MELRLIFLLSLPRSGSTLAQRILAADSRVATASEPWFMLPMVYGRRYEGISAEYGHRTCHQAVSDLLARSQSCQLVYDKALREAALTIYRELAEGRPFFLDKTPRYHLIVEDLLRLFPDAKFLVLWRNPLAVASSILRTWSWRGRWNLYKFEIDLYRGLELLAGAVRRHPDSIYAFRYEDMVSDPISVWKRVYDYLGLNFDPTALTRFSDVRLGGRMGDPTGTDRFEAVTTETLSQWSDSFFNPVRRQWGLRYLRWIGEDRLASMGYDGQLLRRELLAAPSSLRKLEEDILLAPLGLLWGALNVPGRRTAFRRLVAGQRVYAQD